jgi:hypothetical protein
VTGVDEHLLRVGDFLRRTRLSPKALRLYADRGLLAPGREAATVLTRAEAEFPRILDAYDAVARWRDAAGLERSGGPVEVYLTERDVDPARPHLELAWPVR